MVDFKKVDLRGLNKAAKVVVKCLFSIAIVCVVIYCNYLSYIDKDVFNNKPLAGIFTVFGDLSLGAILIYSIIWWLFIQRD